MAPAERLVWDATAMLEALGAGEVALWLWEPQRDRLSLNGASRLLGLGPLAPEAPASALRALALPLDRASIDDFLRPREPGEPVRLRLRTRGAEPCLWRGVWHEEGVRAAGVVAREAPASTVERDSLTGLLDRRSFIAQARERLTAPGAYELVAADLNRLRRLNEALGHERADLVLAALGSRLSAAFPREALLARVGEDEFAVLAKRVEMSAADILREALERPLRVAGFDIHPSLSIGAVAAEGGEEAPEPAELLRRVELAVE